MNAIRGAAIALTLCVLPLAAQDPNRFESVAAGFSVTKPAAWTFVSQQQALKARGDVQLTDEELQKLSSEAPAPLVAFMKPVFSGISPSFQVIVHPMEPDFVGLSPKELLELALPTMQSGLPDFAIETPARAVKLSGHHAAEYVGTYTTRDQKGRAFPTRNRLIVVPGKQYLYFIGMTASRDGYDRLSEEFATILSSITIKK